MQILIPVLNSLNKGPLTIEIVPDNPLCPGEFEEIAARIRDGVGDPITAIDQVRLAAIPASAKDVINIQVRDL